MDSEQTLTINGNVFSFEPGETILDVAGRHDIRIPTLCYLKHTTLTGACRICVVEVKGARSLMPSCATPAAGNMVVLTESSMVIEARRMILQLLLSSGNHNCSVYGGGSNDWTAYQLSVQKDDAGADLCPVWGDCRLQDLAYRYQVIGNRFSGNRNPLSHGNRQPVYCPGFFAVHSVRSLRPGL